MHTYNICIYIYIKNVYVLNADIYIYIYICIYKCVCVCVCACVCVCVCVCFVECPIQVYLTTAQSYKAFFMPELYLNASKLNNVCCLSDVHIPNN